ncbi:MAG: hypothetical protein NWQ46_03425 [Spirosomaceae bacterium]|nr:hypothetical protein [Spirosomataceae bacterium]
MDILLENVNQQYISVLREMAKAMNFNLKELQAEIPQELESRILSVENKEAELVKPDWQQIMDTASKIK